MSKHLDPAAPEFPHGTVTGYNKGCRRTYPCPAEPSCADLKRVADKAARERRNSEDSRLRGGGRYGYYVRRRLTETLAHDMTAASTYTGLSVDQLLDHAASETPLVPESIAAVLDAAWAFLLHDTDLSAHTFPHGTAEGYRAHCRCFDCGEAYRVHDKKLAHGLTGGRRDPVTDHLRNHITALVDAAGNVHQLRLATGLTEHTCRRLLKPGEKVSAETAAKFYAHTPAKVRASLSDGTDVDPAPTRTRLGQLQAQGYSIRWVMERAGLHAGYHFRPGSAITARIARGVEEVYEHCKDTPATPENSGRSKHAISRTRNEARRAGHHPAAAYDSDGTLDVRALPEHPWAAADARAAATLDALYLRCSTEETIVTIARRVGAGEKNLERMLRELGIRSTTPGVTDLDPACRPLAKKVRQTYYDYEDHKIGPVAALAALGLNRTLTLNGGTGKVPADHPELVAA